MLNLKIGKKYVIDVKIRQVIISHYVLNDYLKRYAEDLEKIEPHTLDWIDGFTNDSVFYDIGALSGPFSLYAAIKVPSKVIAFEPEAQNFAALEMNHFLNKNRIKHPLVSLNVALSDSNELGLIYITKNVAGEAMKIIDKPLTRMEGKEFAPSHIQSVMKHTLDYMMSTFNLPAPNYIKIDVDGSEDKVLNGAKSTLANKNLKSVLIELLYPETKSIPLVKLLNDFGFKLDKKDQVEHYDGLYNCVFIRE